MWSVLFSTLALAAAGAAVPDAADDAKPPCCFTNPRYGVCSVQPSEDESCGQILEYLNNPLSQGKSYCGNTNVRGGWATKTCEPEAPPQP